ncbi:MAG: hypothetical protein K9N62_13490 [Verrucomicrobia bacterium]|nr:hypothetical protein [Verrucomicrobiota bacterium]
MSHQPLDGKFSGFTIDLVGIGKAQLTRLLKQSTETSIYQTSHAGVIAKMFDLNDGQSAELRHGPLLSYNLEVKNFKDILDLDDLRPLVPAFYGSGIDRQNRCAFIAMEFLVGQDLQEWCDRGALEDYSDAWMQDFRKAVYEALSIVEQFHRHEIILIDFKPENVIRLDDRRIKFVDMGAFFTPRHSLETEKYVYSATPDYAELVTDTSNVQTGRPLTQTADIFSAGVALFEMVTGNSRLAIADQTADQILIHPEVFLFRDSQIKDVWRCFPHLQEQLPLLQTQLGERRILFSEFWHLLKGYLAEELPDWEQLSEEAHLEMLLSVGTTFIRDQLPPRLEWLAGPIAQATTLRSIRVASIARLMQLLEDPLDSTLFSQIQNTNGFVIHLNAMDQSARFTAPLNSWEVRRNPQTELWAISTPCAWRHARELACLFSLKLNHQDEQGHRFYSIVTEEEADRFQGIGLTLHALQNDHLAWIGG